MKTMIEQIEDIVDSGNAALLQDDMEKRIAIMDASELIMLLMFENKNFGLDYTETALLFMNLAYACLEAVKQGSAPCPKTTDLN